MPSTNSQEKTVFFFGNAEIYSKLIKAKIKVESIRNIYRIEQKYFEIKKPGMDPSLIIFIPASETEK